MCWRGLERTLLQPKCVFRQTLWRFGDVFFIRLALRLISLVTERAAFGLAFFALRLGLLFRFLLFEDGGQEPNGPLDCIAWLVSTYEIHVLVVRETDTKFGNEC